MAKLEYNEAGELALANDIRLQAQRPWLDRLPLDIKTILDVGAGCGAHSKYFQKRGYTATAMDLDDTDFMFKGDVEFFKGNLFDLPLDRKFDAIFLSHVVEHFPNLQQTINHLRGLLTERGYLCIVVPPYEPIVCDNHWQTGWNCGQLAMTLAACGFDCSEAYFLETGQNVCGWGRRIENFVGDPFTDRDFDIEECLPRLPLGMRQSVFRSEAGNVHIPDLVRSDSSAATKRLGRAAFPCASFNSDDAKTLHFGERPAYQDIALTLAAPLDLTREILSIVSLVSQEATPLRIAVSSDADDPLSSIGECWLENVVGVASAEVSAIAFRTLAGTVNYESIRWISIGGTGARTTAKIWAYVGDRLLWNKQDSDELANRRQNALQSSQLYFFRNKVALLERKFIATEEQHALKEKGLAAGTEELHRRIAELEQTQRQVFAEIGTPSSHPYRALRAYRRLPPGLRTTIKRLALPPLRLAARLIRFLRPARA